MRVTAAVTALLLATTAGVASPVMNSPAMHECRSADATRALAGCSEIIAAAEISPADRSMAYALRGRAYGQQKQYENAGSDLARALELSPDNVEAFNYRAAIAINHGRYDRALPDLNAALSLSPGYVGALVNRGFALAQKGD